MRHVEITELTKLVREEEEFSSLRETQYTFTMFKNDIIKCLRFDQWTKEVSEKKIDSLFFYSF